MQAWAEDMEILVCPVARIPLSALLVGSDGKDEPIRSVPAQLQELPEGFTLFHQPPTGLHTGFSVRVYSHSLRFSRKQPQGSGGSAAGSTGLQGTSSRQNMYLT